MSAVLILSGLFAIPTAHTQEAPPSELISSTVSTEELASALIYDPYGHQLRLDHRLLADSQNPLVSHVETRLAQLSENEVNQVLIDSGYSPSEVRHDASGVSFRAAFAIPIAWKVAIALIGLLAAGALIFTALYFNHQEKMLLINKCYEHGGYPVVDSRDKAGVSGTTDSKEANAKGGYKFECKKR